MKALLFVILVSHALVLSCTAPKFEAAPKTQLENKPQSSAVESAADSPALNCRLDKSHAPVMFGLKLGMTQDEVLALFPGSKDDKELRSHLTGPTSEFGNSSFALFPSRYESKEQFVGINQVSLGLLDGRITSYTLGYNGPEYSHVDNFVAKIAGDGALPSASQWEAHVGLENQLKILKCPEFEVRVFVGGPGGSQNYTVVTDTEAINKLKDRRKKARGEATPTPGNQ